MMSGSHELKPITFAPTLVGHLAPQLITLYLQQVLPYGFKTILTLTTVTVVVLASGLKIKS